MLYRSLGIYCFNSFRVMRFHLKKLSLAIFLVGIVFLLYWAVVLRVTRPPPPKHPMTKEWIIRDRIDDEIRK